MGIEILSGPQNQQLNAGRFSLPPDADQKKFAFEFVHEDHIKSKAGRQVLMGIPATADGWVIYKGPEGHGKPHIVEASKKEGKFFLMCRPRDVQNAVNVLYGNLGKKLAATEQEGGSIAGAGQQDPGMLPEHTLRQFGLVREELERNTAQFEPTPIPHIGQSGEHVSKTART